jgi:hypothetical protein
METKTFEISRVPQSNMWKITLSGGGSIPAALEGAWTSKKLCGDSIDRYQDQLKREHQAAIKKREARGKAKTKTTTAKTVAA